LTVTPTPVRERLFPAETVRLPCAVTSPPVDVTARFPVRVPEGPSVIAALVSIVAAAELAIVTTPVNAFEASVRVIVAVP
jgi:hypothetical protein